MLSSCSHVVMAVLVFHQGLPSHQLRFHLFLGTCLSKRVNTSMCRSASIQSECMLLICHSSIQCKEE